MHSTLFNSDFSFVVLKILPEQLAQKNLKESLPSDIERAMHPGWHMKS